MDPKCNVFGHYFYREREGEREGGSERERERDELLYCLVWLVVCFTQRRHAKPD